MKLFVKVKFNIRGSTINPGFVNSILGLVDIMNFYGFFYRFASSGGFLGVSFGVFFIL